MSRISAKCLIFYIFTLAPPPPPPVLLFFFFFVSLKTNSVFYIDDSDSNNFFCLIWYDGTLLGKWKKLLFMCKVSNDDLGSSLFILFTPHTHPHIYTHTYMGGVLITDDNDNVSINKTPTCHHHHHLPPLPSLELVD